MNLKKKLYILSKIKRKKQHIIITSFPQKIENHLKLKNNNNLKINLKNNKIFTKNQSYLN